MDSNTVTPTEIGASGSHTQVLANEPPQVCNFIINICLHLLRFHIRLPNSLHSIVQNFVRFSCEIANTHLTTLYDMVNQKYKSERRKK